MRLTVNATNNRSAEAHKVARMLPYQALRPSLCCTEMLSRPCPSMHSRLMAAMALHVQILLGWRERDWPSQPPHSHRIHQGFGARTAAETPLLLLLLLLKISTNSLPLSLMPRIFVTRASVGKRVMGVLKTF